MDKIIPLLGYSSIASCIKAEDMIGTQRMVGESPRIGTGASHHLVGKALAGILVRLVISKETAKLQR